MEINEVIKKHRGRWYLYFVNPANKKEDKFMYLGRGTQAEAQAVADENRGFISMWKGSSSVSVRLADHKELKLSR